ncbi:chitin synthase-domain-containing protein [Cladochytrium replicatum]|nr:chitin synthase-domain-containing protein [Cladochytrium replicatum]
MCGCLCCSMRLVVTFDLFATLTMPVATAYLIYLIIASAQAQSVPLISVIMLGAAYGLQAMIFIIKGEYQHIGWLIISIIALPIFAFYLPLYSYWHFNDFSWGNTRRVAGAAGKDSHEGGGEVFDDSVVPQMTWKDFELKSRAKSAATATSFSALTPNMFSPQSINTIGDHTQKMPHSNSEYPLNRFSFQNIEEEPLYVPKESEIDSAEIWTGGYPRDEDILARIRYIVNTEDLRTLTKKNVREALSTYFGLDLNERRPFINDTIEAVVKVTCSYIQGIISVEVLMEL